MSGILVVTLISHIAVGFMAVHFINKHYSSPPPQIAASPPLSAALLRAANDTTVGIDDLVAMAEAEVIKEFKPTGVEIAARNIAEVARAMAINPEPNERAEAQWRLYESGLSAFGSPR